jgi:hypothetical protein
MDLVNSLETTAVENNLHARPHPESIYESPVVHLVTILTELPG